MRIDIIEVKSTRRLNWKKVIVASLIVLLIIAACIYYIMNNTDILNLTKNDNVIENGNILETAEENIIRVEFETPITQETVVNNKLPQFTDVGRENIKNIYSQDKKIAYLTFDDGPSQTVTPLILDVLKENNIKAAFFSLGSNVKRYPSITKRAYDEGHYIANHGLSHVYKTIYANTENVLIEYMQTEEAIREAIGVPEYNSHLFRFPGGSEGGVYAKIKNEIKSVLDDNDIAYVNWNALTRDSEGNFTKEQLFNNLLLTMENKNSVVILMHDAANKILTYEVLQDIINYLEGEGFEFGNFYEVIK